MAKSTSEGGDEPVLIKKYANRRLYDTSSSSYITLEHLSDMTRAGREFKVVDAKTGADITHSILTQIIVEEESHGATLLPVNFLRQLISMYGDQMQAMVPHYLEASMESLHRNQEELRSAMMGMIRGGSNPFEALAKQNVAMFNAAADLWAPAKAEPPKAAAAGEAGEAGEVAALKRQLAALQAEIEKLAKERH